ncbi:MAG: hypothetical protein EZS28_025805 [Streblomastix strix]|uniref:Uncharacterized protein n=1 Tax=Streblomastix strix TaxID=222440 RepID=A0A5J4V832_9EUKA|nr:MAG: hypothetical protein EZS28_025805 [Streblomastix strix]
MDHSKNVRQFIGLCTQQTHTQGTNSSKIVDLYIAQLDLDVFQSDRQLTPTVATNALIQRTTQLSLIKGQLVQILEGITGAPLQETDFYATNMSNIQVLEVMQLAARTSQLLQHMEIPAADRQLMPPLYMIEVLVSSLGPQAGRTRQYSENKTFFWDRNPFIRQKQQLRDEPRQPSDIIEIDWHPATKIGIKYCQRTKQSDLDKHIFEPLVPVKTRNADINLDHKKFTSLNQYKFRITVTANINFTSALTKTLLCTISEKFLITTAIIIYKQMFIQYFYIAVVQLTKFRTSVIFFNAIIEDCTCFVRNQKSSVIRVELGKQSKAKAKYNIKKLSYLNGDQLGIRRTRYKSSSARNKNQSSSLQQIIRLMAIKQYLLNNIGKLGVGLHDSGYGYGRIEVQEVILNRARGETISISNW